MKFLINVLFVFVSVSLYAQEIVLFNMDSEVWTDEYVVKGKLEGFYSETVNYNLNGVIGEAQVNQSDSLFTIEVTLEDKSNNVFIYKKLDNLTLYSDSLIIEMRLPLKQEVFAYASVSGGAVILHGSIIKNPRNENIVFSWSEDENNPQTLGISNSGDSLASIIFPSGAAPGEYYFDLLTVSESQDTFKARTFVTVTDSGNIKPFDIKNDHAAWIDSAVIYGVTPYIFTNRPDFKDITKKLPELASAGMNTIWIQPVFRTHGGGQGYDVTNYFLVRGDLGPVEDLKELINVAKENGQKVIFDIPLNHTSIQHRYNLHWAQNGERSHYYNYYMHEFDNAEYSMHYNKHDWGFVYYFWPDLPILNHGNPEVKNWLFEACKYWIREYDIDGYRFDAIWGITARYPEFTQELRLALKRIKPEILMLGEDKATRASAFDERFDAAYDWFPEENWVSHWVWNNDYSATSNPTVFNNVSVNQRAAYLHNSLTNNGAGYAPNAKVLRFLENNDTYHFLTHHSLEQTYMAAALYFSLDGIPLVYNGQMTGFTGHPYSTEFLFFPGFSIQSRDQAGIFPFYKYLAELRTKYPSLYSDNFERVEASPDDYVYAYRRWKDKENIFGIINMSPNSTTAELTINTEELGLNPSGTWYLTDMFTGDYIEGELTDFASLELPIKGNTTKLYLLADSIMAVTSLPETEEVSMPQEFTLYHNYPNPFNPETNISYYIPESGSVNIRIYNIIGELVKVYYNVNETPGKHSLKFNASDLSSGVYIATVEFGGKVLSNKMLLLK